MAGFGGFPPAAFRFLRDLERNDAKAWFEAHRDVYERDVREPMRRLVETLDATLGAIAPEIVGDPKRSMFRIHRDVRFSKNKSPYKTNAGAWLYHRDAGRGVGTVGEGGGAGFYFHLDPTTCFMAGGIWMPARPALLRIRDAIAAQPTALARLTERPGIPAALRRPERGREASPGSPRIPGRPSRDRMAEAPVVHGPSLDRAERGHEPALGRSPVPGLRAAGAPGALAQSRARLPAGEGTGSDMTRHPTPRRTKSRER